jgi:hypothetical protein
LQWRRQVEAGIAAAFNEALQKIVSPI